LGEIDEDFKTMWLESIYKHCLFISNNFSRYSSANNHLIGEATGLFIASIVWQFREKSKAWQKKSYQILLEQIERQNYGDGVNKEQAFSYQQFVLDFFLLAGLLGERNGLFFTDVYWKRIEQMLLFLASVMDRNGNIPNIGDSDNGYAVTLSDSEGFNPHRSLLATGATLFKRGDLKTLSGGFDEKSLWLLGLDSMEKYEALTTKEFYPRKVFNEGGYYILSAFEGSEEEIKVLFDCGPLGHLSLAAHGHSDALSFTLNIGGREFIVDPGTYAYHTMEEWREYFKGTSAHNTICLDHVSQSVSGGNFMWLKKARSSILEWKSNNGYDSVKGGHDGYMRLGDPASHIREVILDKKKKTVKVIDRISAKKRHLIEQFFHFSSECDLKQIRPGEWEIKNRDIIIGMKTDKRLNIRIDRGSINPIMGWQSKRLDVKAESPTMVGSIEHEGDCELVTLITVRSY